MFTWQFFLFWPWTSINILKRMCDVGETLKDVPHSRMWHTIHFPHFFLLTAPPTLSLTSPQKSIYLIKMHKDLIINEAPQEDYPFIKSSFKHPCYTVSHLRGIAAINNHGKINFKLYELVYRVASCSWSPISSTTCQYYECPVALTALRNEQYRLILEVLVWSAGLPSANSLSSAAR